MEPGPGIGEIHCFLSRSCTDVALSDPFTYQRKQNAMTNPLGSFVPQAPQSGDRFQAKTAVGRPLLVQVTGYDAAKEILNRNTNMREVKGAVYVDVWDFVGGPGDPYNNIPPAPANSVYVGVMWMAGALVDNLKGYQNAAPLPVKIIARPNQRTPGNHLALAPLEGQELELVTAHYNADPTRFDRERQARAAAAAQQQHAIANQQTGFAPLGNVQPSQPAAPQWGNQAAPIQGQYPQQAPAAQWAPVPTGPPQFAQGGPVSAPAAQPGPVANIPAQVAQQWSQVDQAVEAARQAQMAPQNGQYPQQAPMVPPPAPAAQAPMQPPATPAFAAPGQIPGQLQVNDTNVAALLAGLTQNQPPQ
jgi:hypothetical protein